MSAAPKNSSQTSSIADDRANGRTFGFLGLSVMVHALVLAGLAMSAQTVRELHSADGKSGSTDAVSMIDAGASETPAATAATIDSTPVEVSTMTDASSDIVASPVEKVAPVEVAPVEKPVAKKEVVKPVAKAPVAKKSPKAASVPKAAPVMTEDLADTEAPTLLANPPGDDEVAPQEATHEESAEETSNDEAVSETKSHAPVAAVAAPVAKHIDTSEETEEAAEPVAKSVPVEAAKTAPMIVPTEPVSGSGSGAQASGGGTGSVIGPIRDASELKALPGNPSPVYPGPDRLARKQGTAVILGRVTADGHVTELKLEKSSGSQAMDASSVQAFRSWRFQAGQEGWVRKPFQFRLVGDAKEVPAPLGKTMTR